MSATLTRTRQALGSQLRETLDDMISRNWIQSWTLETNPLLSYHVTSIGGLSSTFTPGEAMAYVNSFGYDVRFGKR